VTADGAWCEAVLDAADRLEDGGDLEAAIGYLTKALGEAPAASPLVRGQILVERGRIRALWREPSDGLDDLRAALSAAEDAGSVQLASYALTELAVAERYANQFELAEEHLGRAVELAARTHDVHRLTRANYLLGRLHSMLARFTPAREHLQVALQLAEQLDGERGQVQLAEVLLGLAAIDTVTGAFDRARDELSRAAEIYRRTGRRLGSANALRELAVLEALLHRNELAMDLLEEALAVYRQAQSSQGEGLVRLRQGMLASAAGHLDTALDYLGQAEAVFDSRRDTSSLARCARARAQISMERDDPVQARRLLRSAWRTYESVAECGALAQTLLELSTAEARAGRAGRATRALSVALAMARANGDPLTEAEGLTQLAALVHQHDLGQAYEAASAAVDLFERIGYRLRSSGERSRYYQVRSGMYQVVVELAGRMGDGARALRVAEAARGEAFAAALTSGEMRWPDDVAGVVEGLATAQASLALAADTAEEAELARECSKLIAELEDRTSTAMRIALPPQPADLDALGARDASRTHVLVADVDDDLQSCWSIWIPPGEQPRVEARDLSDTGRRVLQRFRERRRLVRFDDPGGFTELAGAVIPAELRAELAAAAEPLPILVVPSAALGSVPFAALRVDGAPLAARAAITYSPSLRVWDGLLARPLPTSASGAFVCFAPGVAASDMELAALERWLAPVEAVAPHDLDEYLRASHGVAVGVISAHGDDGPGLARGMKIAADRSLHAWQLLSARLPPVMVLGTCWSNQLPLTLGQEPLGLPSVCLLGGAHIVIGALFAVGSPTTSAVLAHLYRQLASGMPVSEALREAQLRARHDGEQETIDWAGLVAIGRDLRLCDGRVVGAVP
jgi:tetratricopeptide (TPR) repeat protein